MKLGSFCTVKETMNKMKRQPSEQEKVFANAAQYKKKKINNPIKKWAQDLNSSFSKEDTQMANQHTKRYSTSLVIREMQKGKMIVRGSLTNS